MKNFKILFVTLIASAFLFAAIPTFAEEINLPVEEISEAESAEGAPSNEEIATDGTEENIFAIIYQRAIDYSAEIFSFLSLIGTVFIGYFYRRGLIPSVKGTLSALGSAVGKIKESSDRQCECQKTDAEKTAARLTEFENTLTLYGESLDELHEHLISEEEMRAQRERSDRILSEQINMLYDIFMTSSIPHYQKEATGERINKMRKEIEGYEKA